MSSEVERFLELLAENGLGIDLNPTVRLDVSKIEMYQWWSAYVQRAEHRLQKHAKMILAEYRERATARPTIPDGPVVRETYKPLPKKE